ncbi:MAG TPA: hypothetical protein VLL52_23475 [Anaerolineae bacterium]|nr:hypothetical protein [Anaerolineae bacterium]
MIQTFHCPSCNAPLKYEGDGDPIIECAYCHSSVILPDELRDAKSSPPDWLSSVQSPQPPPSNFHDLNNPIDQIKAIKQMALDGQEQDAAKFYQDTFGVSPKEAKEVAAKLARGESVVISNVSFQQSSIPVISGDNFFGNDMQDALTMGVQVAQQMQQMQIQTQQKQQRRNILLTVVILIIIISILLFAGIFAALLVA